MSLWHVKTAKGAAESMADRWFPVPVLLVSLIVLAAGACGGSAPPSTGTAASPAADIVLLRGLGELAGQRVRERTPGATLQQVEVIPGEGRYVFRFFDAASSRVVSATGATGLRTPDGFTVTVDAASAPPSGSTQLDLGSLRLGPDGVVAVMVRALGAATPRTLILAWQDGVLTWRVDVNGPRGIVRGTVVDASGAFTALP